LAYKKAPINIDNRVVHRSRIKLVGIELEGAWSKLPDGVKYVDSTTPPPGWLGRDGSLKGMRETIDLNKFPYIGELPSPPVKESDVNAWLTKHYPDTSDPACCGMHIHISLSNPLVYMWLMDDEAYPATVVEYFKQWAEREKIDKTDPIWDRLAGNNIYCQHVHAPSDQVKNLTKDYSKDRKGHRYTAIAFHYLRDGLGTIECRLLTMPKTVEQAQRAVKEFISITNRYLVATAKREAKQISTVVADQPAYELTMDLTV
jgi:hypothetical protein